MVNSESKKELNGVMPIDESLLILTFIYFSLIICKND